MGAPGRHRYRKLQSYLSNADPAGRAAELAVLERHLQVDVGAEVQFVMYWGANGRREVTAADSEALLYLYGALKVIERSYRTRCELTLLLTDTHSYLNGYDLSVVESYYGSLRRLLNCANYSHIRMSRLITEHGGSEYKDGGFGRIDDLIELSNRGEVGPLASLSGQAGFQVLQRNAIRHCRRLLQASTYSRGFQSGEAAALAYAALNLEERIVVERHFAGRIFVTYASEIEDFVLPRLPKLRIYSVRKGMRSRPWFIPA